MQVKNIATVLLLSFMITACATKQQVPTDLFTEDEKATIQLAQSEVTKIITDTELSPLDLEKYNAVEFKILTSDGKNYVVLTYDEYILLMELLAELRGRIETQGVIIDEINKFFSKRGQLKRVD